MADAAPLRALRSHPFAAAAIATGLLLTGILLAQQAYAQPERHRETVSHLVWSESAAYEYSVPVTRNATVWPIGAELGMGRAAYYRSVSQFVHVNFTWSAQGAEPGSGIAQADLALHLRGLDRAGRVLWETTTPLGDAVLTDPDLGARLSATLDLDAVADEIAKLSRELPLGDGAVNATLDANVSYALRTSEGEESATRTFSFPISFSDPRVHLPAPESVAWRDEHRVERVIEETRPAGAAGVARALPAQAMILLGAATLVAAWIAWRSDPARGLPPADAAWAREHARYDAWVTTANAPPHVVGAHVDLPTLEELVRVAADTRARVILDATSRIYYVAQPTLTYRYARHAL